MYNCSICNQSFQTAGGLWLHENSRHKESKKFTCKDCGNQFSRKGHLETHVNNIHFGIKHTCDKCDKEFSSLRSKTRHVQSVLYIGVICPHMSNWFISLKSWNVKFVTIRHQQKVV